MKRLMIVAVLGLLVSSTAGCRIGECWRYAWNSRFHPQQQQQTVVVTEPCVMTESCCDPCSSPCAPCGAAPMVAPGPAVSH
jgi:hypothetical protein